MYSTLRSKMALSVDRFELLANELLALASSFRDGLAVIGSLYVARKVVLAACRGWGAFKTYGLPSLGGRVDLCRVYGRWAVVTGSTHGIGKAFAQELASFGVNIIILSLDNEDCQKMAAFLVITGASRGIGSAYAYELASYGMNVMLISRGDDHLRNMCSHIEKTFNVQALAVSVDFNDGKPAFEKIRPYLEDKEIGILVNNVGVMYDYPQYFLDVPYEKLWQLVHVNVAAATMMTHMILPQMVRRGQGAIVTVSSGACFLPTPQMTVYAATKQYLKCFMKALEYEYKSKGITFQCLLPFYVATRMTQYSSTLSNPNLFIPTATVYVKHAVSTLGWSSETPGYWPHSIQLLLAGLVPEWLWMWAATRLNNALRRQAHQRIRHRSGDVGSTLHSSQTFSEASGRF